MKSVRKKQIIYSTLLSIIISIGLIVHGIFFDLDLSSIKRLSIGGFILTFIITLSLVLIIEKLFDLNNEEEIKKVKSELNKLKKNGNSKRI